MVMTSLTARVADRHVALDELQLAFLCLGDGARIEVPLRLEGEVVVCGQYSFFPRD